MQITFKKIADHVYRADVPKELFSDTQLNFENLIQPSLESFSFVECLGEQLFQVLYQIIVEADLEKDIEDPAFAFQMLPSEQGMSFYFRVYEYGEDIEDFEFDEIGIDQFGQTEQIPVTKHEVAAYFDNLDACIRFCESLPDKNNITSSVFSHKDNYGVLLEGKEEDMDHVRQLIGEFNGKITGISAEYLKEHNKIIGHIQPTTQGVSPKEAK